MRGVFSASCSAIFLLSYCFFHWIDGIGHILQDQPGWAVEGTRRWTGVYITKNWALYTVQKYALVFHSLVFFNESLVITNAINQPLCQRSEERDLLF
jgi:hypothetical protein